MLLEKLVIVYCVSLQINGGDPSWVSFHVYFGNQKYLNNAQTPDQHLETIAGRNYAKARVVS